MENRFKVALERIEHLQDGKKGLSKSDVANFKAAFDALDKAAYARRGFISRWPPSSE